LSQKYFIHKTKPITYATSDACCSDKHSCGVHVHAQYWCGSFRESSWPI